MENEKTFFDEIKWTDNYDIFSLLVGNRPPNQNHIRRLKSLILKNGWRKSSLIIVNKNLTVYDGQHRLWALRQIKQETGRVYTIGYQIDNQLTLEKVQIMNDVVLPWRPTDYIDSNIKRGKSDYKFIKEVMTEFELPYTAVLALLSSVNGHISQDMFRRGEVDIKDRDTIWYYASCLKQIKPYSRVWNMRTFVTAISSFLQHPEFNINEFIRLLSNNRDMLYPVTSISSYKMLIQKLYNHRRRDKITFIKP